jgi:hypothetical protein
MASYAALHSASFASTNLPDARTKISKLEPGPCRAERDVIQIETALRSASTESQRNLVRFSRRDPAFKEGESCDRCLEE